MTDPHADDYCVVCGASPSPEGPVMHPVASIENGVICETHITKQTEN